MAWPALGRPRYHLQSCYASGRLRAFADAYLQVPFRVELRDLGIE